MISNKGSSRITFGIIVLNGEPFTRYNLRTLYPFAYQIIVVEGAVPAAANIAAPDGHSTDGTVDILRNFKANEDPQDKIIIVTAEDEGHRDGFWPGEKDEQSQAYAKRATGDYLWQVDIDEFYHPEDMRSILKMLADTPTITAVSFRQITFWGGFDYTVDSWYLREGAEIYHRLFKWGSKYQYINHRPPTVADTSGRNLRDIRWVNGDELARHNIFLYHYSLLFPKQVEEKCKYYGAAEWAERPRALHWAGEVFDKLTNVYRVHNVYDYPSWLERSAGHHPPQIENLRHDILNGDVEILMRPTDDVEQLLSSPRYRVGRWALKKIFHLWQLRIRYLRGFIWRVTNWLIGP